MKPAEPTILVVFGITGDLSNRMLLPSLYHLELDELLPKSFKIVGTSRRKVETKDLKRAAAKFIREKDGQIDEPALGRLIERISMVKMNLTDQADFSRLDDRLRDLEQQQSVCMRRMFYLAVPPSVFDEIIINIGETDLDECSHDRPGILMIEKPFGHDTKSAKALVDLLGRYFQESQIYRVDHFLAKETVQNILYFRFHNPIVKDIWNSQFIDHVQITVAESIGIEGRAEFYEQTGALRDMIQSHLLQLVALTTMAEPKSLNTADIRMQRQAALKALKPISDVNTQVVRGQYEGYLAEADNPDSRIETYVALKIESKSKKWRGIPIYLRTGKAMDAKLTEITLVYGSDKEAAQDGLNMLIIRMHPNEGIALKLLAKKPGLSSATEQIIMDWCYEAPEAGRVRHDAYEKLLVDSMRDEQTLFPSAEETMISWQLIEPVLNSWQNSNRVPEPYKKQSAGPKAANKILSNEPISWVPRDLNICHPKLERQPNK
ncbi:MAG TPA: glucose-6-phosphate dehydrogenase [Candidatus Saccharimonadales bacterium]